MPDSPPAEPPDVVFDYFEPSRQERARTGVGVGALSELPLERWPSLIVTAELGLTVEDRFPHRAPFVIERRRGRVLGQFFPREAGGPAIVIDRLVLERDDTYVARFFVHEGWHGVLSERGEDVHQLIRIANPTKGADGSVEAAGNALEEYRVERALCDRTWWRHVGLDEAVARAGDDARHLLDATNAAARSDEETEEHAANMALHDLVLALAHLAADHLAAPEERVVRFPQNETHSWSVAMPLWEPLLHELRRVPSAATPVGTEVLARRLESLTTVIEEWSSKLGFDVEGLS